MKAVVAANKAAHAAIVAKKKNTFLAQQATMRAAHDAKEEARKTREAAAIALHHKEMAERR